jgi:hypothetical protein
MSTATTTKLGAGAAARQLGISTQYLSELAQTGRIKFELCPYGRVYDADEVERVRRERDERMQA